MKQTKLPLFPEAGASGRPTTCNLVLITSNGQTKVAAIAPEKSSTNQINSPPRLKRKKLKEKTETKIIETEPAVAPAAALQATSRMLR